MGERLSRHKTWAQVPRDRPDQGKDRSRSMRNLEHRRAL